MNYRHAFHAGNFADVLKHVVLARILVYLQRKDGAFRVIDTHAGRGRYDLASDEAARTAEWHDGIAKLLKAELAPAARDLIAPYLDAVTALNGGGSTTAYPGSPLLARHLMRKQDRLTAIELHPDEFQALKTLFAGDHQVRVIALDGWLALGAHLPPKEKRGLVLVDPPFEQSGEFDRLVEGLERAWKRWPGGTYALWYPIKDRKAVATFRRRLRESGIPDIVDIAFEIRAEGPDPRLDGSGMVIVNAPYVLAGEMEIVLHALHTALARPDAPPPQAVYLTAQR